MHPNKFERIREGVNVIGYFQCRLGLGESARLLVSALEKQSIPFSLLSADSLVAHHEREPFSHPFEEKGKYLTNIFCIDAKNLLSLIHRFGMSFIKESYNIVLFFWETDIVPEDRIKLLAYFDEVWVTTRYNLESLARVMRTPVCQIPHPLQMNYAPEITSKSSFGLDDKYTFLFCFDFFSIFQRKNPMAIIEAFRKAFPKRDDVQLVIKTQNGHHHRHVLNTALQEIAGDPRIIWMDVSMDQKRRYDLINASDCYVSLHRSEGFGLTMAEAMLLKKPVIATGYSGNLDFMTRDNSFLCSYNLVPIGQGNHHYSSHGVWADVDIDEAAFWMEHVVKNPAEAYTKALRGKEDLLRNHSSEAVGACIAKQLNRISEGLDANKKQPGRRRRLGRLHVYYMSVLMKEYLLARFIHYRGAVSRRLKKLKKFFNNRFRGQRD